MSTLERAIIIATTAHAGQCAYGGAPYILHPPADIADNMDRTRIAAPTERNHVRI